MTNKKITFVRKHGDGLKCSSVYVNGARLEFDGDSAAIELTNSKDVEVYWRVLGQPKSTFSLKAEVGSSTVKIAQKFRIPKRRTRKSDFSFVDLK